MIDLSIVIPVYNAALLLNRCLDSIFNQHTQFSYEVIIVDDGSSDNSVEIVNKRKEQDKIVLYQQNNQGPAIARNKGVELANGIFCSYLDADDYWVDGYIEKSVAFMKSHPECIAVTVGQKYLNNGELIKIHPTFLQAKQSIDDVKVFDDGWILNDFYRFWVKWEHVGTCSTTVQRELLIKSGGQRAGLRICEDMEFWPYLASYGLWGFIPEILYVNDGVAIVQQQGWAKYVNRFTNVPMYGEWFKRLKSSLTPEQLEILKPVLNGVICGHSRAMISGGDYKKAYENLKYIYEEYPYQYPVKIRKLGYFPYCIYAFLWRLYQYIKINRAIIKSKLSLS